MNTKILVGGFVALLVAFGLGYAAHSVPAVAGAANPNGQQFYSQPSFLQGATFGTRSQSYFDNAGKLTLGVNGTAVTQAQYGTCNLSTGTASFSATTTVQFYCAVTGVAANDLVIADLPVGAGKNDNGAGSPQGGFSVVAAYATTSNMIGVTLLNLTGAATTSYPQATTSVEYRIVR